MLSGVRDDLLTKWRDNGYVIMPEIIKPPVCRELIGASDNLPPAKEKKFTPCIHPHRFDLLFQHVFGDNKITKTMEVLLGGKIYGIQTEYFFCKPGTVGFSAHQDNYYVKAKRDVFGSVWLALEDVAERNGCLIVYKGSHVEPLLPVREIVAKSSQGQDPDANRQEVVLDEDKYEQVDVCVKAGSAVFIHGHVVHRSYDNRSNRSRNVLLMTYIKQGEDFRKGFSAKRETVDIYK